MYSKIVNVEVWNFMAIEHGIVEFDERGIINLKGYNDSGKSAILRAVDVLMYNITPNKQVEFIQDDKDYFRVIMRFEDGVLILRDKYINGQSLYEMYKGNDLIFTTKSGKTLTKVSEVPQPIQDYLGLLSFESMRFNSRSCFEKQIGVETTGSENYKAFNTVLKSEELTSASQMINNDKNKLISDMNNLESDLTAAKDLSATGGKLTLEMIEYLKMRDSEVDTLEKQGDTLNSIKSISSNLDAIRLFTKLRQIDRSRLDSVAGIGQLNSALGSIKTYKPLQGVSASQLIAITELKKSSDALDSICTYPKTDASKLFALGERLAYVDSIASIIKSLAEIDSSLAELNKEIGLNNSELVSLEIAAKEVSKSLVRCPACGMIFDIEEGHVEG